ncbi:MAG TPA: hypothetical protein VGR57_20015, partial [Ktedonobacterales bacterium]|nr:hypothetical protein [Ktedonobacterales bacterium]
MSAPRPLTRAIAEPLPDHALPPAAPSRWRAVGAVMGTIARLGASRAVMAGAMLVTLLMYLWNAHVSVDLPLYDESTYFSRGVQLLRGNFAAANMGDVTASPLYVLIYAGWFALLRTYQVYPWVLAMGIVLVGLGAYLLLSRLLHPTLSWVLATFAVVGTAPIVPSNALYYVAAGSLWIGLSLLGTHVARRGLAAFVIFLTVLLRPDFLAVLVVLLVGLLLYEYREWRRDQVLWGSVLISYAPALTGLYLALRGLGSAPADSYDRVTSSLPWSYTDYYHVVYPAQFGGIESYTHPWVLFERDFGPVPHHTLTGALLAMLGNPPKLAGYLGFEIERLVASFGTAALSATGWRNNALFPLPVTITAQTTWLFLAGLALFAGAALACAWSLLGTARLPRLAKGNTPALIGVASLSGLLPVLILVNPHQRFFMIYPLLLLGVGYGLLCIIARVPGLAEQTWLLPVLAFALVMALPQPFIGPSARPTLRAVAFLRAHLPNGAVVIGEPAASYTNYLDTASYQVQGVQAAQYGEPVLLNALAQQPALGYALLTPSFSDATYQRWFSDWSAAIPDVRWRQVAAAPDAGLRLFALPVTTGNLRRLSYRNVLQQQQTVGGAPGAAPAYATVDFGHELTLRGASAQNDVRPLLQLVGSAEVSAIQMHPPYAAMPPSLATQVSATLTPDLAGRSLLFATALTPWASAHNSGGVRLTFTIAGTTYSRTYEVTLQDPAQWQVIAVPLPRYTGTARLTLTIT